MSFKGSQGSKLMTVVYEGVLQLGKDPSSTSTKDWKSYLFVLKRDPESKKSALYFYKDLNKRWQKQTSKGCIELWPYIHLSLAHKCSYKYPLKITDVKEQEYLLAASSFDEMNKWCNHLQSQCYLVPSKKDDYCEFPVKPNKSVSTSLLGITGDCILALTPQRQLVCALRSTRQLVGVWPYGSLRTYWSGKEVFGFKSGRRSPRGEGEFTFVTDQGEEIYRRLARAIKLTSLVSKSQIDSKPQIEESLPPDPTRAETPVPFSDSDEELPSIVSEKPPPPLPDKPPELLKRLSMGGLPPTSPAHPHLPPTTVVTDMISETAPAYITSQNPRYIHQKAEAMDSAKKVRPPIPHVPHAALGATQSAPIVPHPFPLQDDTYSHATHDIPPQVGRHASLKTTPSRTPSRTSATSDDRDKIYHGLDHTVNSPSRPPLSTPPPEGDIMYDIAYPTPVHSKVPLPIPGGEYGSMGDAEDQKRVLMEKKMSVEKKGRLLSKDAVSFGAQLRGRVDRSGSTDTPLDASTKSTEGNGDNIMTANPLYGSNDNLLVNFMDPSRYSPGGYHDNDPRTDSTVANPVYGEHMSPRVTGFTGSVGMKRGSTPISPLEDSLIANPVYGETRKYDPLQVGKAAESKNGASALSPDSNSDSNHRHNSKTGGDARAGGEHDDTRQKRESEQVGEEQTDSEVPQGRSPSHDKEKATSTETETESSLESSIPKIQEKPATITSTDISAEKASDLTQGTSACPTSSKEGTPVTQDQTSPPTSVDSPSHIQRNKRGYSKVDKTRKAQGEEKVKVKEEGEGEDISPPPPIPPRKYSNSDS